MTTITVEKTKNGIYEGFTCTGHAGFGKKGRDIVCAAVSVLAINTINSMEELAGEKLKTSVNEETGFLCCRFQAELSERGILLMDSMILGLSGIEKEYGDRYFQLKFKEV